MKNKGFTLIELLMVVAIIGLLSSVVLTAVGQSRDKGKATRILSDFVQIEKALYALSSEQDRSSWWTEGINGFANNNPSINSTTFQGLEKYLPVLPTSPVGGPGYRYDSDQTDPNNQTACTASNFRYGVNIQLEVTSAGRKYFDILDRMVDSRDGVHCGRIKWNSDAGNESIFFQVANHYSNL